jgi:hypothetical protein
MTNQESEIKNSIIYSLEERVDPVYFTEGFTRRPRTVRYERKLEGCIQLVETCVEYTPKDNPNAAAAIYPWLSVRIDAVDVVAGRMTGNNHGLLASSSPTLHQPIDLLAPIGTGARWFVYQSDSIPAAITAFVAFSQQWVFPFLREYIDAQSMITMYRRGDKRVLHDQNQFLRIVAAMLQQGEFTSANETLEKFFGRPANRRRFASVFEFVEQHR